MSPVLKEKQFSAYIQLPILLKARKTSRSSLLWYNSILVYLYLLYSDEKWILILIPSNVLSLTLFLNLVSLGYFLIAEL